MQHSSAVLGDEQVFDVELDRHTELLPVREDAREVSWHAEQQFSSVGQDGPAEEEEEEEPEPGEILSRLARNDA